MRDEGNIEDRDWQRLDKWMWCARFLKARAECARLVAGGMVRLNRQATEKAHARVRPGDMLTLPLRGDVMVVRVLALASRRGPSTEARTLYAVLEDGLRDGANDCISGAPVEDGAAGSAEQVSNGLREVSGRV